MPRTLNEALDDYRQAGREYYLRQLRDTQQSDSSPQLTRPINEGYSQLQVYQPPLHLQPTDMQRVSLDIFGMSYDRSLTEQVSATASQKESMTSSKARNTYRDFIRKHTSTG